MRLHAEKAEAVIELRRFHRHANSATKRALERDFHGLFALRPHAAAGLDHLSFPVQLIFQPHAAGKTANRENGWILHREFCRSALALAKVHRQLLRQLELLCRAEVHWQKHQRQQNEARRQAERNGACRLDAQNQKPRRQQKPNNFSYHSHFFSTGISVVLRISASTDSGFSSIMRALLLSISRWAQTSGKMAATSSGMTKSRPCR